MTNEPPACIIKEPTQRKAEIRRTTILVALLTLLVSAARAVPVITMDTPPPRFDLESSAPGSGPAMAAEGSVPAAWAFQTLTAARNGSFRPFAPEGSTGNDRNINALVGLDDARRWHRSALPGASVFVGRSASLERTPLANGSSVFLSQAAASPSSVEPLNQHLSFAGFPAQRGKMADTLEMFGVGERTVSLPIAAVGVVGALGSSLAIFIGMPADADESAAALQ